jgi:hypothetical protein
MKKTAVIDIDNTLWQFCDPFCRELRKVNRDLPPPEQWTTFDFWERYCSRKQFIAAINAVHRDQDNERHLPYPGAQDFLQALRKRGYRIVIASHRMEAARQPTARWLSRHQLVHDELHLSFDKSVLFGRAAVVVDDAPQTLQKAVAAGALAAGLLFPWNRAFAGNGFGLFPHLRDVLNYIATSAAEQDADRT